ncbi:MAG: hypothetical protein VXW49_16200 [Pseudomonadota bacterium]|nr:hypothetical protein [Pseudomonadota bacterium]
MRAARTLTRGGGMLEGAREFKMSTGHIDSGVFFPYGRAKS